MDMKMKKLLFCLFGMSLTITYIENLLIRGMVVIMLGINAFGYIDILTENRGKMNMLQCLLQYIPSRNK